MKQTTPEEQQKTKEQNSTEKQMFSDVFLMIRIYHLKQDLNYRII